MSPADVTSNGVISSSVTAESTTSSAREDVSEPSSSTSKFFTAFPTLLLAVHLYVPWSSRSGCTNTRLWRSPSTSMRTLLLGCNNWSPLNHCTEGEGFPDTFASKTKSPSSLTIAELSKNVGFTGFSLVVGAFFASMGIGKCGALSTPTLNCGRETSFFVLRGTVLSTSTSNDRVADPELFVAVHTYFPMSSEFGLLILRA